jgi:RimJ/RimL family protein N-acetyltransferase
MNIKFRNHKRAEIPYRIDWYSKKRVADFLGYEDKRRTKKSENKWFDNLELETKKGTKRFYTVCDGKKPIGVIGLSRIHKLNKNADLFIVIGDDDYVGKGISKAMIEFIINYGFEKRGLNKISLGVFTDNIIAVNLYKKMGFILEGTLKDESFFGGRYHDLYTMAIFNKKKK